MISLEQACKKAMEQNPDLYVYLVNEYADAYECVLLTHCEKSIRNGGFPPSYLVNKETGEILENTFCQHTIDKEILHQFKFEDGHFF